VTPQPLNEPLTRDAIFLVVLVNRDGDSRDAVRGLCGDLAGLVRAVGEMVAQKRVEVGVHRKC